MTFSGEFSSGYNPCGLFLLGVGNNDTTTGDCELFTDSSTWNATVKQGVLDFTLASMDALQNWWFWTWKVSLSLSARITSYQSLISACVDRLVPPLSRAKLSRLCGRISLDYRTVGYHQTPAWPSESARRLAAVTVLPSQAHTLRGRRVGLEQAQSQYRDPTLGRPLHYQALRETYTPLSPRTRRLVPSRHYRLLNLHPRYHRGMAGSIRRIRRAR